MRARARAEVLYDGRWTVLHRNGMYDGIVRMAFGS